MATPKRLDASSSDFTIIWYPGKLNTLTFKGKSGELVKDYLINLSETPPSKGVENITECENGYDYDSDNLSLQLEIINSRMDAMQSFIEAQGEPLSLVVQNLKGEITQFQLDLEEEKFKNRVLEKHVSDLQEEVNVFKSKFHGSTNAIKGNNKSLSVQTSHPDHRNAKESKEKSIGESQENIETEKLSFERQLDNYRQKHRLNGHQNKNQPAMQNGRETKKRLIKNSHKNVDNVKFSIDRQIADYRRSHRSNGVNLVDNKFAIGKAKSVASLESHSGLPGCGKNENLFNENKKCNPYKSSSQNVKYTQTPKSGISQKKSFHHLHQGRHFSQNLIHESNQNSANNQSSSSGKNTRTVFFRNHRRNKAGRDRRRPFIPPHTAAKETLSRHLYHNASYAETLV